MIALPWGSANATKNSLELCYEMIVVTRSLKVTRELRSAFDALWADSAPLDVSSLPQAGAIRRSRSWSRSASIERERSKSFAEYREPRDGNGGGAAT